MAVPLLFAGAISNLRLGQEDTISRIFAKIYFLNGLWQLLWQPIGPEQVFATLHGH
jgi:hypothetical protein